MCLVAQLSGVLAPIIESVTSQKFSVLGNNSLKITTFINLTYVLLVKDFFCQQSLRCHACRRVLYANICVTCELCTQLEAQNSKHLFNLTFESLMFWCVVNYIWGAFLMNMTEMVLEFDLLDFSLLQLLISTLVPFAVLWIRIRKDPNLFAESGSESEAV
jgi:hypothetical protein